VLDGLLSGVVVILVDLLVNGSGLSLMLLLLNGLLLHCRCDALVNSSLMVTRVRHELLDGILGCLHFD